MGPALIASARLRLVAFSRVVLLAAFGALLSSCGGGGGGGGGSSSSSTSTATGSTSHANICTANDEKLWVLDHMTDIYLFYKDLPTLNPASYATPVDFFNALIVRSKDRFSFSIPTAQANSFFQAGQDLGYGATYVFDASGKLRIAYSEPGGPSAAQGVTRGAEITAINGVAVPSISNATLNAELFPTSTGVSINMDIRDLGATATRNITLSSASVTTTPVPTTQVLTQTDGSKVGYVVFNDHIATAESPLASAMSQFQAAGINDLVLDIRYNGGGYIYIASEVAAMIGGNRVTGQVFEKLRFNDKHPEMTNDPANTFGFQNVSTSNQPLPQLGLSRVFVLTGPGTCSASESIINGLSPFVQVILIGGTTCGKPYGFIQADNCQQSYFAIQFEGTNALGQDNYANGFSPTCPESDDLNHALGDTSENLLSSALSYRRTSACPPVAAARAGTLAASPVMRMLRPPQREMRLIGRGSS